MHRETLYRVRASIGVPGTLRFLFLLPCVAVLVAAQSIAPSAYTMPNGELGPGGLLYRDDLYKGSGDNHQDLSPLSAGLGQLTDGTTGCSSDPSNDCVSGACSAQSF